MIEVGDTKHGADAAAAAARESHGGAASAVEAPAPASYIKPLVLQSDIETSGRDQYHAAELLQYHDRHFIENAYLALLGREPFAVERARELDELRSGRAGKIEIIERLLSSPEVSASGRRVRVEGLPSPLMRRLGRVPFVGYVLRLARALVRLPVSLQHQQQFEIYALAQQQLIADYINQVLALYARGDAGEGAGDASAHIHKLSPHNEVVETLSMFSDALLDLSNSHAELQAQTQTQAEQAQAALTNLTQAIIAQQQITETLRREQQTMADAQQEFLIQEQRVIVETQKAVLEELREELRALSQRQQDARATLDAEVRRLQTLLDASAATAATPTRENFSEQ
jgi:hypothetical protein